MRFPLMTQIIMTRYMWQEVKDGPKVTVILAKESILKVSMRMIRKRKKSFSHQRQELTF